MHLISCKRTTSISCFYHSCTRTGNPLCLHVIIPNLVRCYKFRLQKQWDNFILCNSDIAAHAFCFVAALYSLWAKQWPLGQMEQEREGVKKYKQGRTTAYLTAIQTRCIQCHTNTDDLFKSHTVYEPWRPCLRDITMDNCKMQLGDVYRQYIKMWSNVSTQRNQV